MSVTPRGNTGTWMTAVDAATRGQCLEGSTLARIGCLKCPTSCMKYL